jgi:hypothetical protein
MRADRALFIKAEARKREGGDTEPEETPDGSVA